MNCSKKLLTLLAIGLGLIAGSGTALAAEKSADEVAKELANPTTSLASLNASFLYSQFRGDLPNSRDQDSWQFQFQPSFPFPVGNGNNIIVRPLIPVFLDQPVFDANKGDFDDKGLELGDISGDLVLGGTTKTGFLRMGGLSWSLPTATSSWAGSGQVRLGPEAALGIVRKWGIVGALAFHQWGAGGWRDGAHSVTSAQYFYAISLGKGWQIASSPIASYDWNADSDDAWTLPLGIGVAKTTTIGNTHWKFALQGFYYVKQPDTYGEDWGLKFTITPVIKNPFL